MAEPMTDSASEKSLGKSPPNGHTPKRRKMQIASDSEDSRDDPPDAQVENANVKKETVKKEIKQNEPEPLKAVPAPVEETTSTIKEQNGADKEQKESRKKEGENEEVHDTTRKSTTPRLKRNTTPKPTPTPNKQNGTARKRKRPDDDDEEFLPETKKAKT